MPATALPVPTLSRIQAWGTDHLESAATRWEQTAEAWGHAFTKVHQETLSPGGTPWIGAAADAAAMRTGTDRRVVVGVADSLASAATAARNGAGEIAGAGQLALQAIEGARAAGFDVREDLSVFSRQPVPRAARAALQAQAEVLAANIRTHAASLLAVDQRVAADINAAITGLSTAQFDDTPFTPADEQKTDPAIQLVDNHTFRQSPADDAAQPPGGWSDDPGMRAAQHIAYGHAGHKHAEHFPGMTRDKLAEMVHDMMTGSPKTDPDLFVGQGERNTTVLYRDGILVIYDPSTSDGGTVFKPDEGFDKFLDLTAPIVSAPPTIPAPNHLPQPVPPAQTNLPPGVTLPPVLPAPELPPWLQNPAPPGFHVSPPGQVPGPIPAPWDVPDTPSAPVAAPPMAERSGAVLPPIDGQAAGPAAVAGVGGALVIGLFGALSWLAHPFQAPG